MFRSFILKLYLLEQFAGKKTSARLKSVCTDITGSTYDKEAIGILSLAAHDIGVYGKVQYIATPGEILFFRPISSKAIEM